MAGKGAGVQPSRTRGAVPRQTAALTAGFYAETRMKKERQINGDTLGGSFWSRGRRQKLCRSWMWGARQWLSRRHRDRIEER